MKEPRTGGILKNWSIVEDHLVGAVYGDTNWKDGEIIRTSPIKNMDFETREVTTRNTVYLLGNQRRPLVESEPVTPDPAV